MKSSSYTTLEGICFLIILSKMVSQLIKYLYTQFIGIRACYIIIKMNLLQLTDQQLEEFVIKIYQNFDKNGDGVLQVPQLANFFTCLYKELGYNIEVTWDIASKALKEIDANGDGKISPKELYFAFKHLISSQQELISSYVSPYNKQQEDHSMDVQNCKEWNQPHQQ